MAGVGERVIMSYYSICLKRTRTAIVPVVLGDLPPVGDGSENHPAHDHDEHGYANKHKPVGAQSIPGKLFSVAHIVVSAHRAAFTYLYCWQIRLCSSKPWRNRICKFSIDRALDTLNCECL